MAKACIQVCTIPLVCILSLVQVLPVAPIVSQSDHWIARRQSCIHYLNTTYWDYVGCHYFQPVLNSSKNNRILQYMQPTTRIPNITIIRLDHLTKLPAKYICHRILQT